MHDGKHVTEGVFMSNLQSEVRVIAGGKKISILSLAMIIDQ